MLKAIGIAVVLLCVVVGGALIAYWVTYPAYTHRMKVFIEIEDGAEVRSGSGVLEVRWQFQPALGPGAYCDLQGDAILIELKNTPVVAILNKYHIEFQDVRNRFCTLALLSYGLGSTASKEVLMALANKSGRVQVPPEGVPSFLVFSDPTTLSTAKLVFDNDLSQVLGPGVRLRGVSLELTNEPITRGIVERVPAVASELARKDKGERRRPGIYEPFPTDFSQGEKK